jgi:protein kinase A
MRKFDEAVYCAEITFTQEELLAHDVVFRDLKPENMILDGEGHIKQVDFGLAKEATTS